MDERRCTQMARADCQTRFRLLAPEDAIAGKNLISATIGKEKVDFMVLGPSEAKGFEAGANVASCPRCRARVEACMCPPNGKS